MTNNDVIRLIRETFDFSDATMSKIFSLADKQVSGTEIGNWLKREHDPAFKICYDDELAAFLNGLIINMRGPKDGPATVAEQKLSNNLILKKIKIALDLKAEDLRDIIALTGSSVSNYELSAFF
ncbi:MAG: DUF1456 family protein, partial [Candidatus Marinimicrobia bacterium]|nr:DUF1456 family protein [Candidatus Neomarinimicrobiota bacterium]